MVWVIGGLLIYLLGVAVVTFLGSWMDCEFEDVTDILPFAAAWPVFIPVAIPLGLVYAAGKLGQIIARKWHEAQTPSTLP